MRKRNKGITLIALIITIIIMLILVAVSIDLIVDGKLFDSAGDAVSKTNEKVEQQQNRVDELMGKLEYVESKQNGHDWKYTDNTLKQLKCTCGECKRKNATGVTYSIGQQVKRTSTDTLLGEGETPTGTEWVVFGAEDCDGNGTNEILLITTLKPSTEKLKLGESENLTKSADDYKTGIEQIEAKVKEIYGNEARAITIEDVNRTLGYVPTQEEYFTGKLKDSGELWTRIVEYHVHNTDGVFYTPDHPQGIKDNGAELGEYVLGNYDCVSTEIPETTSNVVKSLIRTGEDYWLASKGAFYEFDVIGFGIGQMSESSFKGALFGSNGWAGESEASVRPLVPLSSEMPVGGKVLVVR